LAPAAIVRSHARLPKPLNRFIGRSDEVGTITELLQRSDVRLINLTGPGGIGKTRLSIEVATPLEKLGDWSVSFVPLATVLRTEDAMPAIADTLGVWNAQKGELIQRISEMLDDRRTLLVLDNLEHVIDIAVDLGELLIACPNLKLLVTSRTPLHIQGEREYSVPQLLLADPEGDMDPEELLRHEAIALFVDRAQAIRQEFVLDEGNAENVAQICARLEGLPLAIELAAAKIKVLPPAALLSRLDNQLQILRSDFRDVPDRLQTMRATIGWSYGLLTPDEQRAINYLSVFAGDFSLAGAEAVLRPLAGDTLDILASLIDNSLMISRGHFNDQPYYRILMVVREFGLEQLNLNDDVDQVRLQHAEFFARVAKDSVVGQFSEDQGEVFRSLDRAHDNIRQALNWAIATERWELAARIAGHLWQYWVVRGNFAEGRQWFACLLDQNADYPIELLPDLYFGFAYLAGTPEELMQNPEMARRLLQISEATGDHRARATGTILAGIRPWDTNGMHDSLAAMELWTELGEPIWAGRAASEVSRIAREIGDIDLAEDYAHLAGKLVRDTGHVWAIAQTTTGVGRILHLRGRTKEAMSRFKEALSLISTLGDWILAFRVLEIIIDIAGSQRQYTSVIRLSAATSRMRTLIGYDVRSSFEQTTIDAQLEKARSAFGEDTFVREWSQGRQFTLDQAIAEAMTIAPSAPARTATTVKDALRLSARELDVLQQVIKGRTDQEIADDLFVSYRTITTHVSHILNKLGASSRTEAAAIAVRDRLI
jgi:predicted ATPase/DNA-binding CsgD family transcriptional regulator